jgi:hypothetical protein
VFRGVLRFHLAWDVMNEEPCVMLIIGSIRGQGFGLVVTLNLAAFSSRWKGRKIFMSTSLSASETQLEQSNSNFDLHLYFISRGGLSSP